MKWDVMFISALQLPYAMREQSLGGRRQDTSAEGAGVGAGSDAGAGPEGFGAVFQIFDNPGNGDQHLRAAPRHIHHLCAPV